MAFENAPESVVVTNSSGQELTIGGATVGSHIAAPTSVVLCNSNGYEWLPGGVSGGQEYIYATVSPTGVATGGTSFNNGANFGPDTPGTTTSGINEAINSLPRGSSPPTGGGAVYLRKGVYSCTGQIIIPNAAGTMFELHLIGESEYSTVVNYTGATNQDFITTAYFGASLSLNMVAEHISFTYQPNNQKCIMNLGSLAVGYFSNCAWFDYNFFLATPNLQFSTAPPTARGQTGLRTGPVYGNLITFNHCTWGGLAIGYDNQSEHVKMFACQFGSIGQFGSSWGNAYTNNLQSTGPCIWVNPQTSQPLTDIGIFNCHFVFSSCAILDSDPAPGATSLYTSVFGGTVEGSNYMFLSANNAGVKWEGVQNISSNNTASTVSSLGVISGTFPSNTLWIDSTANKFFQIINGNILLNSGVGQQSYIQGPSGQLLEMDGSGNLILYGGSGSGAFYLRPTLNSTTNQFVISSTGVPSMAKGLTLVGTGMAIQVADGAQVGATSTQTLCSYVPPAAVGLYRINATIETTSGTNTGTIALQITYHNFSGTAITATLPLSNTSGTMVTSGTGASTVFLAVPPLIVIDTSATAITCSAIVTGTVHYNAFVMLEEQT